MMRIISVPDNRKLKKLNEGFFDDYDDVVNEPESSTDSHVSSETIILMLKEEYEEKLNNYMETIGVFNYIADYSAMPIAITVKGHLRLTNKRLSSFPSYFYFKEVAGDVYLSQNRFTTMEYFPRIILGDLVCTGNYLTRFDSKIELHGQLYAERQMCRTDYKLTDENFRKFMTDKLNENRVYIPKLNEYGTLQSIDHRGKHCKVELETGKTKVFLTEEVDYINGFEQLQDIIDSL